MASLTFRTSGRTYHFPFRLILNPIRKFIEPMVRQEFAYNHNYEFFEPFFTFYRENSNIPYVFYFQEFILQSLIRHYLSQPKNLQSLLEYLGLNDWYSDNLEVLGEKALSEVN